VRAPEVQAERRERDGAATTARVDPRLDWRFLFAEQEWERVAFVGRDDSTLLAALRSLSGRVRDFELDLGDAIGDGSLQGLVLRNARYANASRAMSWLVPGGWLYWECERSLAGLVRSFFAPSPAATLRRAGFETVRVYWLRPRARTMTELVPLDLPGAVNAVLARSSESKRRRAATPVARLLHRAHVLQRFLPSIAVVARRPGGAAPAGDPASFLAPVSSRAAHRALRTPRFAGSRHVIAFAWNAGRREPDGVAKIPRTPGDESAIHHEMTSLARLEGAGIRGVPRGAIVGAPQPAILLQTFVRGQVLKPAVVRARPSESLDLPIGWLTDLHRRTRRPVSRHAWIEAALLPFRAWLAPGAHGPFAANALRTRERVLALGETPPCCFEHGDFAAPNILLDGTRVGVVDWEASAPEGIPAIDLFFFLAFVAGARRRALSPPAHLEACAAAFGVRGTWAHDRWRQYAAALELEPASAALLFLLTWARTTARLAARAASGGALATSVAPETARSAALWDFALDQSVFEGA
jgi:hypothetical protein